MKLAKWAKDKLMMIMAYAMKFGLYPISWCHIMINLISKWYPKPH